MHVNASVKYSRAEKRVLGRNVSPRAEYTSPTGEIHRLGAKAAMLVIAGTARTEFT